MNDNQELQQKFFDHISSYHQFREYKYFIIK